MSHEDSNETGFDQLRAQGFHAISRWLALRALALGLFCFFSYVLFNSGGDSGARSDNGSSSDDLHLTYQVDEVTPHGESAAAAITFGFTHGRPFTLSCDDGLLEEAMRIQRSTIELEASRDGPSKTTVERAYQVLAIDDYCRFAGLGLVVPLALNEARIQLIASLQHEGR